MDPRASSQHTIWAAVTSLLLAVLLFQVAGSLMCYSCLEEGNSGCSPANVTTVQCVPPMNVCIEYTQTVSTGAFTVIRLKKGCSWGSAVGIVGNTTNEVLYHVSDIRACSTDLCNNELQNVTVTRPEHNTKPNGLECYSCASFSKDQCSSEYVEKINCTGDMTRCYEGNVTVTVDDGETPKAIYFKTCEMKSICITSYSVSAPSMMISQQGSCCSGKYCNGPASSTVSTTTITTSEFNSQVPSSSVSHLSLLLGVLMVIGVL